MCNLPVAVRVREYSELDDLPRCLEMCHLGSAVLDQILFGSGHAVAEDHERLDTLSPLVVGNADDSQLGNRRVAVEPLSSTSMEDTFPARDDDVFLAVGHHDERPVQVATVPGVEPAFIERLADSSGCCQ